jgi:predicted amidohydrolase YtcJ
MESTSHAAWVNDAALAALGFDASSPDPNGGVILRGDDGAPTGLLLDAAAELVFDVALAPGPDAHEQNVAALREGLAAAAANGITALGDGRCFWKRGYDAAWRALDDEGALTLRAVVPLWAYPEEDDDAQLAFFRGYAPREGTHLTFGQVKLYADGITWLTTGAMLEPYTGPTFAGPTGLNYFDAARLTRYVTELEREGYDLHIHAIGDRGVREALDAIAAARATNGDVGARHRITHVEWVAPDDVPRFAELGVVADIQLSGVWTQPQFLHDNDFLVGADTVDERAYRLRDLQDAGARITLSSDYDVGPMSPFVGVARAVDRGDQSLRDRSAALRAVTVDAAWVLRTEQQTGSLEAGKRADFIVVDRDVFTTPALADTVVCATWFEGHEVFRRSDCGA